MTNETGKYIHYGIAIGPGRSSERWRNGSAGLGVEIAEVAPDCEAGSCSVGQRRKSTTMSSPAQNVTRISCVTSRQFSVHAATTVWA